MSAPFPDFSRAEYLQSTAAPPPPPPPPKPLVSPYAVDPETAVSPALYRGALVRGLLGALVGSVIYALVGHWVVIGYVAILVGALVAGNMMHGSDGQGGRRYQITAVVLTYFAVSLAFAIDVLWDVAQKGQDPGVWAAQHPLLLVTCVLFGPFMQLVSPVSGLVGLLILFFGMQAAWRIAKGGPGFPRTKAVDSGSPLGLR